MLRYAKWYEFSPVIHNPKLKNTLLVFPRLEATVLSFLFELLQTKGLSLGGVRCAVNSKDRYEMIRLWHCTGWKCYWKGVSRLRCCIPACSGWCLLVSTFWRLWSLSHILVRKVFTMKTGGTGWLDFLSHHDISEFKDMFWSLCKWGISVWFTYMCPINISFLLWKALMF